jgi:quercetin dioxygenase-like cupin family protein
LKIIRFKEAEHYEPEKDWRRTSLCSEKEISVEHFIKPPGHASPRHEHPNTQILVVLEGELAIYTDDDKSYSLAKGDAAYISGDEAHIVVNPLDTPATGIDIFVPGRPFDFWLRQN